MRPLKLELQYFGPYEHETVDFTQFPDQSLFWWRGTPGPAKQPSLMPCAMPFLVKRPAIVTGQRKRCGQILLLPIRRPGSRLPLPTRERITKLCGGPSRF